MTTRRAICLVTNELYPLNRGGIGRLMYNFARQNAALGGPVDLHFLTPPELLGTDAAMRDARAAFADTATFHVCRSLSGQPHMLPRLLDPAYHDFTVKQFFARSYMYYRGLIDAQEEIGQPFDIVEFPDFGGWAAATVEAKRAGFDFHDTKIAVRLHSTHGMISRAERFYHAAGSWGGMLMDCERFLLAHADLVVGHVGAVIELTARHYGMTDRWAGRTRQEFPPVLLETYEASRPTGSGHAPSPISENDPLDTRFDRRPDPRVSADPDFVFSSRLQPIKRPDLFVRAAIVFLETNPGYSGTFRLIAYGWDQDYIDGIKELIPAILANRILVELNMHPDYRAAHIRDAIVVIPSQYESLCIFAFEAAQMSGRVILNRACAAFGQSERWRHGVNCLMFDGTPGDLADAMGRALGWTPREAVSTEADAPYWITEHATDPSAPAVATQAETRPSLSLVAFGAQRSQELRELIYGLDALDLDDVEVRILIPNSSIGADALERAMITERGWHADGSPGKGEDPASFHRRLLGLESELIALLPAGYELHPGYLAAARAAFARAEPDLVAGHVRVIDDLTAQPDTVHLFFGEAPSTALISNRIAPRVSVLRRSLLETQPFDDRAGRDWFEAWSRDLVNGGANLLIMPMIAADMLSAAEPGRNSKRLTAGVLDRVGLDAGLPARLLGVDPVEPPDEHADRARLREGAALGDARLVGAGAVERDFSLVANRPDLGGLLVHPTEDRPTIAAVDGMDARLRRIEATARNAAGGNMGIEFAIGLVPRHCPEAEIAVLAQNGPWRPDQAMSDWVMLRPGEDAAISLSCEAASFGNDRVLMMARVPEGCEEAFCHLVYLRLEETPNFSIL